MRTSQTLAAPVSTGLLFRVEAKVTLLRFTPDALSRSRFALSPLAETVASAVALQRRDVTPWTSRWVDAVQPAFRAATQDPLTRGLVALTASTRWLPDYLTRPPLHGMATRIEDELAEIEQTADDTIRADLVRAAEDRQRPDADRAGENPRRRSPRAPVSCLLGVAVAGLRAG